MYVVVEENPVCIYSFGRELGVCVCDVKRSNSVCIVDMWILYFIAEKKAEAISR